MRLQTGLLSLFLLVLVLASYVDASVKKNKNNKNKKVTILSDSSTGRGDAVTLSSSSALTSKSESNLSLNQPPCWWTRPTPHRLSSSRIRILWCKVSQKRAKSQKGMSKPKDLEEDHQEGNVGSVGGEGRGRLSELVSRPSYRRRLAAAYLHGAGEELEMP